MTKQRFSKFLALSALAHILLAAVLLIAERQKPAPIQQIQVELVDRSKVKKFKKQIEPPSQQVVEQDEKQENILEISISLRLQEEDLREMQLFHRDEVWHNSHNEDYRK